MNPELEAKLSALLDGELAPDEAAALREEVSRSPELAERLAALAAVDAELRALPGPPVPAGLRARVAVRVGPETAPLRGARSPVRRTSRSRARRWLAAAALAAAAAALVLLALPSVEREEAEIAELTPPPAPARAPAPPPAPTPEPDPFGAEELAEAEDLPVIEVLDLLAELDELEDASG